MDERKERGKVKNEERNGTLFPFRRNMFSTLRRLIGRTTVHRLEICFPSFTDQTVGNGNNTIMGKCFSPDHSLS